MGDTIPLFNYFLCDLFGKEYVIFWDFQIFIEVFWVKVH
jgi:hypothetical protein